MSAPVRCWVDWKSPICGEGDGLCSTTEHEGSEQYLRADRVREILEGITDEPSRAYAINALETMK
jgi:hypothetical protein